MIVSVPRVEIVTTVWPTFGDPRVCLSFLPPSTVGDVIGRGARNPRRQLWYQLRTIRDPHGA